MAYFPDRLKFSSIERFFGFVDHRGPVVDVSVFKEEKPPDPPAQLLDGVIERAESASALLRFADDAMLDVAGFAESAE